VGVERTNQRRADCRHTLDNAGGQEERGSLRKSCKRRFHQKERGRKTTVAPSKRKKKEGEVGELTFLDEEKNPRQGGLPRKKGAAARGFTSYLLSSQFKRGGKKGFAF